MEEAVVVGNVNEIEKIGATYTRVYFGNEFCERLIPDIQDFEKVLDCSLRKSKAVTLVTPYVTDSGLERLISLFDFLKRSGIPCEVVVNDWGTLNLINREYLILKPVLGRLLTKQKRCPRLKRILQRERSRCWHLPGTKDDNACIIVEKKLPVAMDSYYKGSNVSSVPVIQRFLNNSRVSMIEIDNIEQGLSLDLSCEDRLLAAVHFPYVYITTTFFCPIASIGGKRKVSDVISSCDKPCRKYVFLLRHKSFLKSIYLAGNTQFYKYGKINAVELSRLGVARTIYHPQIAF